MVVSRQHVQCRRACKAQEGPGRISDFFAVEDRKHFRMRVEADPAWADFLARTEMKERPPLPGEDIEPVGFR